MLVAVAAEALRRRHQDRGALGAVELPATTAGRLAAAARLRRCTLSLIRTHVSWTVPAAVVRSKRGARIRAAPSADRHAAVDAEDVPGHEALPAPSRYSTASSSSPERPPRPSGVRDSRKSGNCSGSSPSPAVISDAKKPGRPH